jgi:heptosyltransferase-2
VPEASEKIVVVLPNHLGDVVMATPALRALRAGRPRARITALVPAPLDEVLRGLHSLDRLVGHRRYAERGWLGQARGRWQLGRAERGADLALVLPNSFAGALLAWSIGAERRVGYARRARGWLLTDAVAAPREGGRFRPLAMERYYLDLVRHLGCPDTGTALELATEPGAERECDALFARHGIQPRVPLVCLAPGAGFGPSKLWPLAYLAEVAGKLLAEGAQVALVHGPGEAALAAEIQARTPGIAPLGGDRMGLSLLKSVLARAALLICNDAGARHVAAAFGVPTLVLMGPTSLAYTNLNLRKTRVLREPVECSPCQRKVCPIDHRCMTRILPERVLAEARAALADPAWVGSLDLELRA